jgi:hypothetical protein
MHGCDARRIGERKIALVGELLGRQDATCPAWKPVVLEGAVLELVVHAFSVPPATLPVPAGANNYNRRTIGTLPHTPIARRAAEIQPFEVMDVLTRAQALEAAGRRVVHMEIGEPDFTAPEPVVEAAVKALRDGLTAYTPALGIAPLREATPLSIASASICRVHRARSGYGRRFGAAADSVAYASQATSFSFPIPDIPVIATSCGRSRGLRGRSPCRRNRLFNRLSTWSAPRGDRAPAGC